jgi:ATP-dependent helicase/nuclease subunit A
MKNEKQDFITDNLHGIYVVDAGAGTGKTYCITNRYINILNQNNVNCEDILLLTFTNNAASNMKDKIISKIITKYTDINILDTNISTFDSFCNRLLTNFGENVPKYLGINLKLNSNFKLIDNNILNNKFFKKIYFNFQKKKYNDYKEVFDIINNNYEDVLKLIFKLQSRGIFPTNESWFLDGKDKLVGNIDLFLKEFNILNKKEIGKTGKEKQSVFLTKLKSKIRSHIYDKNSVAYKRFNEIYNLNSKNIKTIKTINNINDVVAKEIYFLDNRNLVIKFVHDIYIEYIKESLKENKLTFGFLSMFTLVLLYYNTEIQKNNSFEFVMIDEFQDTNELQFLLTLLLMKTNNLLVVGDWKQGIYSFRNATINNILEFSEKIKYYKNILNKDKIRIDFNIDINKTEFDINFRSSQKILDFSKNSLLIKASNKESNLNIEDICLKIVDLKANFKLDDSSNIKFIRSNSRDNEMNIILYNILKITNNKEQEYNIKEIDIDGNIKYKKIEFKDIAVLCRDRKFALDLQRKANKLNIPTNYEGGVDLFNKECSIILLAYLKLINNLNNKESWSTILDYNNYTYKSKKEILYKKIECRIYPKNIVNFRNKLLKLKNINLIVNEIFKFNNIKDKYSNKIISIIYNLFENNLLNIGDLIYFIEENIKRNETYNLDDNENINAINIQTIHASKGLEYAVVFISNINKKQFPSTNKDKNIINYNNKTGIRLNKNVCFNNSYYSEYNNIVSDFVNITNKLDYDEERRLFYVSITRAKQYLFLSSYNPSLFYNELLEKTNYSEEYIDTFNLEHNIILEKVNNNNDIIIPKYTKRGIVLSVHDIMKYIKDENIIGKGIDFGNYIHSCAQKLANNIEVDDYKTKEVQVLRKFIKTINAKRLLTEVDCSIKINNNLIRGNIDLICEFGNNIFQIIDYKTDTTMLNHNEYIKQLSLYYHCLKEKHINSKIICKIYYITQNKIEVIKPLSINKIQEIILSKY